jgi:hypothetical protein
MLPLLLFRLVLADIPFSSGQYQRYEAYPRQVFTFALENASLSLEFLMEPSTALSSLLIDDGNINISSYHFLFEPANPKSIRLSSSASFNFSVWAFQRSICSSQVSVFASQSSARFRRRYREKCSAYCFFTIGSIAGGAFDNFIVPNRKFSDPYLAVYSQSSIPNATFWVSSTEQISESFRESIFFGVSDVYPDAQWALNLELNSSQSELCDFRGSPVYNGETVVQPTTDSDHRAQCEGFPGATTMWMYLAYAFVADGSILVITVVAYLQFRRWSAEKSVPGREGTHFGPLADRPLALDSVDSGSSRIARSPPI